MERINFQLPNPHQISTPDFRYIGIKGGPIEFCVGWRYRQWREAKDGKF